MGRQGGHSLGHMEFLYFWSLIWALGVCLEGESWYVWWWGSDVKYCPIRGNCACVSLLVPFLQCLRGYWLLWVLGLCSFWYRKPGNYGCCLSGGSVSVTVAGAGRVFCVPDCLMNSGKCLLSSHLPYGRCTQSILCVMITLLCSDFALLSSLQSQGCWSQLCSANITFIPFCRLFTVRIRELIRTEMWGLIADLEAWK